MKVFLVDDGEQHWMAAPTLEEAFKFLVARFEDVSDFCDDEEDDLTFRELSPGEASTTMIYEEDCVTVKSAQEWADECDEPAWIGSSVW